MSHGGSLHKKDWIKIGVTAAAATTGLGALGIGPMAGLFGAEASPALASLAAEEAGPGAAAAIGSQAAGSAPGALLDTLKVGLGGQNVGGLLRGASYANQLMQPPQIDQAMVNARPPPITPSTNTVLYPQKRTLAIGGGGGDTEIDDDPYKRYLTLLRMQQIQQQGGGYV